MLRENFLFSTNSDLSSFLHFLPYRWILIYFHLDSLCLAVHAHALFSGLPDAQGLIQHVWDHVERPSFGECLPEADVSLLSWSSVDTPRCIFSSGLYLVVHQLSALHSYTPHKPQSHRGSQPWVGPAGLWGTHRPSLRLLAQPEAQPRAAGNPQASIWTGNLRSRSHQHCGGDQRSCVTPAEWGLCVPQAGLMFSVTLSLLQQTVKVITAHLFCCFLIKSYFSTISWSQKLICPSLTHFSQLKNL